MRTVDCGDSVCGNSQISKHVRDIEFCGLKFQKDEGNSFRSNGL